jgi:hypothetical protein
MRSHIDHDKIGKTTYRTHVRKEPTDDRSASLEVEDESEQAAIDSARRSLCVWNDGWADTTRGTYEVDQNLSTPTLEWVSWIDDEHYHMNCWWDRLTNDVEVEHG